MKFLFPGNLLAIILFVLVSSIVNAQNKDGGFVITGNLPTWKGDKAYLGYFIRGKLVVDSATVKNGVFTFTGKVEQVSNARISNHVENLRDGFQVLIENSNITLAENVNKPKLLKITGSTVHSEMEKLMVDLTPVLNAIDSVNKNGFSQDDSIRNLNSRNVLDSLNTIALAVREAFAKNNPKSFISLYQIRAILSKNPEKASSLYNSLIPAIQYSYEGSEIKKLIDHKMAVQIGKVAPDFTLKDTSGHKISLSAYKGKYVLIDFWASWCRPCREENPNVKKAYDMYKDKGFVILGVSIDDLDKKQLWKNAIKKDELPWLQVIDDDAENGVAALYAVEHIPYNYLLSPKGEIIAIDLRGKDLLKRLEEIFG